MNSYRDYTTLHEGFFKDIVDLTFNSDPEKFWDHAKKYFEYSKDTNRSKFNSSITSTYILFIFLNLTSDFRDL